MSFEQFSINIGGSISRQLQWFRQAATKAWAKELAVGWKSFGAEPTHLPWESTRLCNGLHVQTQGGETFISIERWKAKGLIVVLFKPSVALQKFCKHTLSATERDVLKSPNM